MKSNFAACVSQGHFASAFPNVSYDSSLMAIDNIVGVVSKTPYVKYHELFWFCIDVAAILALTDKWAKEDSHFFLRFMLARVTGFFLEEDGLTLVFIPRRLYANTVMRN